MITLGLKSNGAACEGEGYISMTGGRAAPTGPTGRLKNNNNTTVPPPPMGAGAGQCTRPTNKQTILAPNAKLALYNTDPEQQRKVFWAVGEQEQLLKKLPSDAWQTTTTGTFEQTTQAVGDIANTDLGEPTANPGNYWK